jgi:hypothetical protein
MLYRVFFKGLNSTPLPVLDDFRPLKSWSLHTETAISEGQGQRVQEGEGSLANLVDLWIATNLQHKFYLK